MHSTAPWKNQRAGARVNGCEGVCENNSAKRSASKLSDIHNGSTGKNSLSVETDKVQALAQEEISHRKGQDQPATHDDGQPANVGKRHMLMMSKHATQGAGIDGGINPPRKGQYMSYHSEGNGIIC